MLSELAVRNAKPAEKPYKLADAKGLYLLISPAGGRLWKLKFRHLGKEGKLSLGAYPSVGLATARKNAQAARELLAGGVDPSTQKKLDRTVAEISRVTTFASVAKEYIKKCEGEGQADATITKTRWIIRLLQPAIGDRPVSEIGPHEILAVLKKLEARGHRETAKRTRSVASRVFRYAIATVRAKADPAALLQGAIAAPVRKHHATLLDPNDVGKLLQAMAGYDGKAVTRIALLLTPHVFVRPGELRRAEWSEIDWKAHVWRIPSAKMKARREHVVPLSRQALALFREIEPLTGDGRFVFPSLRTPLEPMSENTINAALRRLGYSGDEMTAHGFRAMASSLLNESGKWHPDAIERALAHKETNTVRAAYHRGAHWNERVKMAQWWSDYLTGLQNAKSGGRHAKS